MVRLNVNRSILATSLIALAMAVVSCRLGESTISGSVQIAPKNKNISISTDGGGAGSTVSEITGEVGQAEDFFINITDSNGDSLNPDSILWEVISGPASITVAPDSLSISISAALSGNGQIQITIDGQVFLVEYSIAAASPPPSCPGGPTVFATNMSARTVIGQTNFVNSSANQGGTAAANTLKSPLGVWVKDGKLYVGDSGNHRVLIYNTIPTTDGAAADAVVGQPDFVTASSGTSATQFAGVQGVAVDDNYLMVSEWSNNRISFWPLSNLSAATHALGQPDLVSGSSNQGGTAGANTIKNSSQPAFGGNKYFATDVNNNRVVVYDKSSFATGMSAETALGQPDFLTTSFGSADNKMDAPLGVFSDGTKLFATDLYNNRVLVYNDINSLSTGVDPDLVVGGSYGNAANQMDDPISSFYDGTRLLVVDRNNDRILIFNSLPSPGTDADIIIGQPGGGTGNHNQCNCSTAAANTLWGPHFVYWDGCRLYVSDTSNHRVLIY
ncbi:MAG: NHL repeat-containing protein [Bdellovibrionales bacterium]|nr:NHL repeat-containing protein [Bdellovibrionales bacterium]